MQVSDVRALMGEKARLVIVRMKAAVGVKARVMRRRTKRSWIRRQPRNAGRNMMGTGVPSAERRCQPLDVREEHCIKIYGN